MYALLSLLFTAAVVAHPQAFHQARQSVLGTSTVTLSNDTGTPRQLASGMIYGIPDTPNQIPDEFYVDMGFNYARAGGAQVAAPGRGWIWGLDEYKVYSYSSESTRLPAKGLLGQICISTLKLSNCSQIWCILYLSHP